MKSHRKLSGLNNTVVGNLQKCVSMA